MKVGDLVKLPMNEGYAIVYELLHRRLGDTRDICSYGTAVVVSECGLDYWDPDACEVVSES